MSLHTGKGFVCFLLAIALLAPTAFTCSAVSERPAAVDTVNIGMQPFDYKRMIATTAENKYDVRVEVNSNAANAAKIQIRGSGSKEVGMMLPTKRLPIELTFAHASDYSAHIANTCVKFCNVITPFELMAQHVAYDMFSSLGIPTPAHSFALIQYNDVDFGVYFALEDINSEFLSKNFSGPYGSLYKGAPANSNEPYSSSQWFGDLRAVTDGGHERLNALIDALNRGVGYEEYLDVDETMRFFACTAAYGGISSLLTEQSNYFLYDTGEKLILLPWDLSEAFCAEPTNNGIDHFRLEFWEDAPPCELFDLLMRDEKNRELYHGYIRQLCENFLAAETFDPYFESLVNTVSPYMQRDCTIYFNWEQAKPDGTPDIPVTFQSLQGFVHQIRENLLAQLEGTEDTLFFDPTLTYFQQGLDDIFGYVIENTPTMNLHITQDICRGYMSYCRSRGISRFATGDPEETVAALVIFSVVFLVLLLFFRFSSLKKDRGKNKKQSAHRRC